MSKMQPHHDGSQHQKPKLLNQMRTTILRKHYSIRTKQAYIDWIKRYIFFYQKWHPFEMGAHEIELFFNDLNDLAVDKKLSSSTVKVEYGIQC